MHKYCMTQFLSSVRYVCVCSLIAYVYNNDTYGINLICQIYLILEIRVIVDKALTS